MRAKDLLPHSFACHAHHAGQPGPDLMPGHADDEGSPLPWASEPCDSFPSNWEAAWIDLGGEG